MNTADTKVYTEQLEVLPIVADYLTKIKFIENIDAIVNLLQNNHRRFGHGKPVSFLSYISSLDHM